MAVVTVATGLDQTLGLPYTHITDDGNDWTNVGNDIYFFDKATKLVYYKNASGTVVKVFEEGGGGDSIYSADGTVSADRIVSLDSKKLTFNPTTGNTTDLNGCNVSIKTPTGVMGVSNNGTNAFTIFDVNDNPLWIFKDNGNTVSENGKLAIGTSSNLYSSDFSVQGKTIFQAKNAGSAVLGGWAQSNGASITTMFENGKMIFGGFQLIGSEKISIQGETFIQGTGTTTGTTLALYDADSPSPNKTWEWLDNGNVNLSIDSVITLNNTLKIESGQTYLDNGSFNPLVLNVKSSGVDGIGLDFNAYNSSNVETNFARIVQAATDVTAGSENGGLLLRTMISGTLRTGVTLDNREFLIDAANFTDNGFRVKDGIIDCLKVTTNKQTYIESGSFNPLVLLFKSSGVDGIGLDFNAYNSSNAEHNFARIIQAATDVTAGSENGGLLLRVSDNGTITTKIEINSNKVLLYDNLDMNNNRILNSVVNPSVQEAANSATFTINADEQSDGVLTAMSASTTIAAPTGTPVQSQDLVFRFKDDGTARSLTWNAVFRAIGVTLPTTTVANKLTYVGCKYNSTDSKWDVIAVQQEA